MSHLCVQRRSLTRSKRSIFQDPHPVVNAIVQEFGLNKSKTFTVTHIRRTLRRFGQYHSRGEVEEIFAKLGVGEGELMTMEMFEKFLLQPRSYMPAKPIWKSFW